MGNKASKMEKRKSKKSKSTRSSKTETKKSKSRLSMEEGIESFIKDHKQISVKLPCKVSPANEQTENRYDSPIVTPSNTTPEDKTKSSSHINNTKKSSSNRTSKRKERARTFSSSSKSSTLSLEPLDSNENLRTPGIQIASRNSEPMYLSRTSPSEGGPITSLPEIYLTPSPEVKVEWLETAAIQDDGTSSSAQNSVVDHIESFHSSSAIPLKIGSLSSNARAQEASLPIVIDREVVPVKRTSLRLGVRERHNSAYLSAGSYANDGYDSAFMHSEGTMLDASLDFSPWNFQEDVNSPAKADINMEKLNPKLENVYSISDINIVIGDSESRPRMISTHSSKIVLKDYFKSETPNGIVTNVFELSDVSGDGNSGITVLVSPESGQNLDPRAARADFKATKQDSEEVISLGEVKAESPLVNEKESPRENVFSLTSLRQIQLSTSQAGEENMTLPQMNNRESMRSVKLESLQLSSEDSFGSARKEEAAFETGNKDIFEEPWDESERFHIVVSESLRMKSNSVSSKDTKKNSDPNFRQALTPGLLVPESADLGFHEDSELGSWYPDLS